MVIFLVSFSSTQMLVGLQFCFSKTSVFIFEYLLSFFPDFAPDQGRKTEACCKNLSEHPYKLRNPHFSYYFCSPNFKNKI